MRISLRPCGPEDWEVLRQTGIAVFTDTFAEMNTPANMQAYLDAAFNENTVRQELANPDSAFWLALAENGAVAGYLKVNFRAAQHEFRDKNAMEIQRIYVARPFQGQGVAQMLMEKAREAAVQAGVDFIWLGVWEHNPRAIRFYEKTGFRAVSSHAFFLGDEEQTDILMQLNIN